MNRGIVIDKKKLEIIFSALVLGKNKKQVAEWLADLLEDWNVG